MPVSVSDGWNYLKPIRNLEQSGAPGLSFLDVRLLVGLLGNVVTVEGGLTSKRKFLLEGVSELVSADAWAWSWYRASPDASSLRCRETLTGKDNSALPALVSMAPQKIAVPRSRRSLANVEANIQPPQRTSDEHNDYAYVSSHRQLSIGVSRSTQEEVSSFIFVRKEPRTPFTTREKKITDIIGQEVHWLYRPEGTLIRQSLQPKLSPRERAVLSLLITGIGRQEIAEKLKISVHTVHAYVKSIYESYGVNSQAALARFFANTNYGK